MTPKKFRIVYPDNFKDALYHVDRKYWPLIREEIEKQLLAEPDVETKNRKPLTKPPIDSIWEIRFGPKNIFRVFYKIQHEVNEVWILAFGIKKNESIEVFGEQIL